MSLLPATIEDSQALVALLGEAEEFYRSSRAKNTRVSYDVGWRAWSSFAARHGVAPLPAQPTAVALWATEMARTYKPSTIAVRLAAVAAAHREAGLPSPTADESVRRVVAGIRRTLRVRPAQKAPILVDALRDMIDALPASLAGSRDRALLLTGFGLALRRSELVALDVEDLTFVEGGCEALIRASKSDVVGFGVVLGLPNGTGTTCAVGAIRDWLDSSGITAGPLLRAVDRHGNVSTRRMSDRSVARIVKRAAASAGMDDIDRFAGHSLRSGFATSATLAGASAVSVSRHLRHASLQTTAGYQRVGLTLEDNAASRVGL